jgi:hypothetical protein
MAPFSNYRVFQTNHPSGKQQFSIRLTRYPDGANPWQAIDINYSSHPSAPTAPTANTLAELKAELELMLEALRRPVLLDARELGEELGD